MLESGRNPDAYLNDAFEEEQSEEVSSEENYDEYSSSNQQNSQDESDWNTFKAMLHMSLLIN